MVEILLFFFRGVIYITAFRPDFRYDGSKKRISMDNGGMNDAT